MKINLNSTSTIAGINNNFQIIEDELNNKVLYRDNPVGEPNTMESDLDMNEHHIYNLPEPTDLNEPARLQDIRDLAQDNPGAVALRIDLADPSTPGNGADMIGYNGGTVGDFLDNVDGWKVVNIAALKTISKFKHVLAFVQGYYAKGDQGGGWYWCDLTDTTSVDDGGSIIVAADGGRWKLIYNVNVSVKQFGAKGDGTTDDTARIQSAFTWAYTTKHQIFVNSGTYKLTSKVSTPGPITLIGELQSPPITPDLQQAQPQVTFLSTVASDYALSFGSATYERGGHYENFRIYGAGITGSGMLIKNQGWDGYVNNVTVESFVGIGITLDFLQDSVIQNVAIIDCGIENASPSLNIVNASNIIKFNHLRLEITPYMMNINNGADMYFSGCHFEVSEYVSPPFLLPLNRYSRFPQIVINGNSTDIQFDSCIFGANSVQGVATHFGVSPTTVGPMINVPAASSVRFSKSRFVMTGAGRSSNYISFNGPTSATSVTECTFSQVYTDVNSIVLADTIFVNNNIDWLDNNSTLFHGIANAAGSGPSIVENNKLVCSNAGTPVKVAGYLFQAGVGSSYIILGYNQNSVQNFFKHHNSACIANSWMQASSVNLNGFSGTIDLENYDINSQFYWTGSTTVNNIINACSGQRVKLWNNSAGIVTTVNTANVNLKGAVNAAMGQNGIITLENYGLGPNVLIEITRNF